MADNSNAELVVAFSTAGSPEEARRIATALVAEQLAACVNIVDNIHSIYRWQGAIESAAESLMLIKTRANLLSAIELRLRELHSYDVPELVAIPIGLGAQPYLDWLLASTGDYQKIFLNACDQRVLKKLRRLAGDGVPALSVRSTLCGR
jgi:periplasmic divalent cation tolerance protein